MDNFRPKFYYAKKTSLNKKRTKKSEDRPSRLAKRQDIVANQRSRIKTGFQIGQTLTSNSEPSERDNLKKLRSRKKRITKLLRYSLVGIALLLAFLRFFIFKIEVQFTKVNNQPNIASYQKTINDYFTQQPFERLSFNTDKQHLEQFLQIKHPEIKTVKSIITNFLRPSQFLLELRQPVATMMINQKRYYVDATGVSFINNHMLSPSLEITDQSGIRGAELANKQVISSRFLRFVGRVVALSAEKGYEISGVTIPANAIRQVEFKVKGFEILIKMTTDREAAMQVEDMARSLAYIKKVNLQVQYLDVRVENKAYYKSK